jgi:hypothetical protein
MAKGIWPQKGAKGSKKEMVNSDFFFAAFAPFYGHSSFRILIQRGDRHSSFLRNRG